MSSTKERRDLEDLTRKSLAVQWLGLWADAVKGRGSNPGLVTKVLQAMWGSQIKKKKRSQQQTNSEGRGLSYREAVSIKTQGATVIHCSMIHNSQDMETIHWQMNK